MPHASPPRSAAARASVPLEGHCWPVHLQKTLRHSKAGLAQTLWGLWVLVCTRFCISKHLWWVWGFILNTILPLLPSCWGLSFALGQGVSFLVGSNILFSMVVQQQVAILKFSQEKMSTCPSPKIVASDPITTWQIDGKTMEIVIDFIFLGSKITADCDCSHEIKRHLLLRRKAMTNLDRILKWRHYFADKGLSSQSYGFSSSHMWMWDLDYKESWALKNYSTSPFPVDSIA